MSWPVSRAMVFWAVLAACAVLWQPGFYLNDEFSQALGLASLHQGSYVVDGAHVPEGYRAIENEIRGHYGIPPEDSTIRPIGSDLLNALALPVRVVLGALATPLGVGPALGLVASLAIFQAARTHGLPLLGATAVSSIAWATSWRAVESVSA